MGRTMHKVIRSKAMKLFGLKPFGTKLEQIPTIEFTKKNNATCGKASAQDSDKEDVEEMRSENEASEWKFLARLLDRCFFLIHVTVVITVITTYLNAVN